MAKEISFSLQILWVLIQVLICHQQRGPSWHPKPKCVQAHLMDDAVG